MRNYECLSPHCLPQKNHKEIALVVAAIRAAVHGPSRSAGHQSKRLLCCISPHLYTSTENAISAFRPGSLCLSAIRQILPGLSDGVPGPIIGQVCRIDSKEDIAMGRQTPDEFHLVFEVPLYRRDRQDHSRNAEPDAHGDKRWIGATIR